MIVTATLLMLPLSYRYCPLWNDIPPYGESLIGARLPLTLHNLVTTSFQKRIDKIAIQRSGFWGIFQRISNQVALTLFQDTSKDVSQSVLLGHDGHLFQPMYLTGFNRTKKPRRDVIATRLKLLRKFTKLADQHGSRVLYVLSPNKMWLYPEIVPSRFVDKTRLQRQSSFDFASKIISKLSLPVVNTSESFAKIKDSLPFSLIAETGSHWNDVASCIALKEILVAAGISLPAYYPECLSYQLHSTPNSDDLDLLHIANFLLPEKHYQPTPYVNFSAADASWGKDTPKMLLVGTSFLFALADKLYNYKISKDFLLYFYYREVRGPGETKLRMLDKQNIDWCNLFQNQVIILEANIAAPGHVGFGFLEDSMRMLKRCPKQNKNLIPSIPRRTSIWP